MLSILILTLSVLLPSAEAKYNINLSKEARKEAIAIAKVRQTPGIGIPQADLRFANESERTVECKWNPNEEPGGTSPKFYCQTAEGQSFKVKYGSKNG